MAEKQTFKTVLEKHPKMDATGITIPFDVEKVFGAKRVPVKVSINGAEYRSTIARMGGKYMLVIPKVFRDAARNQSRRRNQGYIGARHRKTHRRNSERFSRRIEKK